MTPSSHGRFLITRLSALGDCVLTLPLLCALRDHFPTAHISWLIQPESAPLLRHHPDLDEIILIRRGWLKSPREICRVRARLRSGAFDVVLDPQSLTKSALAGWLSGCPRRIGLAPPRGREAAILLNNDRIDPAAHVIHRYLGLLKPLGISSPAVNFRLPVRLAAWRKVQQFLQLNRLTSGFVVLNPGAGWPSRRWPADRYALVADWLYRKHGIRSVVNWFGAAERNLAMEIVGDSGGGALPAPRIGLEELTELLRAARLFLGSDTGPLHMAAAVSTPCVAMFGTTRAQEVGPLNAQHILLQEAWHSGTTRERRRAPNDAMRMISVDQVIGACDSIVGRSGPAGLHWSRPATAVVRKRLPLPRAA